ncbi:MAG TPA: SH3 domain-containing protein, partial [Verrucomicrobiae bacterium]|nr:SH3 domain-containing protein [Verrucomicrobiae bacterium]
PPPEPTPMTNSMSMPALPPPTMEAPTNAATPPAPKKTTTARKKTAPKKTVAAKKKAPEPKTVPLVAGPAVVDANHVNIRSKAGLVGEVLTHVTNGEPVTVIEEIHLKKSGPDEPSAWAKILLPPETHVWVKSSLLDSNNAVSVKKVNLRAGPGENYGVLGTVNKGDVVQVMDTKGEWTQIQAPTNAYAFMAAQYLKQEEGGTGATVAANPTPTPETPMTTTTMPEMPTVAAPPTEAVTGGSTTEGATAPTTAMPTMPDTTMTPAVQEPPPPRIVEHEGVVRGTFSIQAPSKYELVAPDTKQPINYLYTTSTNLDLSRYKGMHIIVTGEEALDPRWKNTPVITIQKIQVLD